MLYECRFFYFGRVRRKRRTRLSVSSPRTSFVRLWAFQLLSLTQTVKQELQSCHFDRREKSHAGFDKDCKELFFKRYSVAFLSSRVTRDLRDRLDKDRDLLYGVSCGDPSFLRMARLRLNTKKK